MSKVGRERNGGLLKTEGLSRHSLSMDARPLSAQLGRRAAVLSIVEADSEVRSAFDNAAKAVATIAGGPVGKCIQGILVSATAGVPL